MMKNALIGGVIGFCVGLMLLLLLPILIFHSPTLYWLADMLGKIVETLMELGIRLMCGSSPDIGCASGLGMIIFFILWPLLFCIFWALMGAVIGVAFSKFESS